MKQRRTTREESIELKKQLDKLKKLGRIRESRSSSAVNILFVPKQSGAPRMCMDYRPVNQVTRKDENKAPLQDMNRHQLQGAKWFTKLDMEDGYHRLRIREGDEGYTAFITEYGLYEWTVMSFGLANAPAEFARFMTYVLGEYINDFVTVYFDDVFIYSITLEEHRIHVKKVLQKLLDEKITIKARKCDFEKPEVDCLGHIVGGESSRMQSRKVQSVLDWPEPKNLKEVERFRGLVGYYRQFIKGFSGLMKPLNEMLRKKEFQWTTLEKESL